MGEIRLTFTDKADNLIDKKAAKIGFSKTEYIKKLVMDKLEAEPE